MSCLCPIRVLCPFLPCGYFSRSLKRALSVNPLVFVAYVELHFVFLFLAFMVHVALMSYRCFAFVWRPLADGPRAFVTSNTGEHGEYMLLATCNYSGLQVLRLRHVWRSRDDGTELQES